MKKITERTEQALEDIGWVLFVLIIVALLFFGCSSPRNLSTNSRQLVFESNFDDLSGFTVKHNEFYNQMDNWFDSSMVSIKKGKLHLDTKLVSEARTSWQRTDTVNYLAGMVTSEPICNYGLWVFRARVPDNFSAIWLLKKDYELNGVTHITPEVDIMEVMRNKPLKRKESHFQHTVHYNQPIDGQYTVDGKNKKSDYSYRFHEFAVDLLSDGYDFYVNGILVGKMRSKDPKFTSGEMNYIVLNSAIRNDRDEVGIPFEVDWVRIYKNEWTTKTR